MPDAPFPMPFILHRDGTRQKTSADFDLLIVDLTSISERPAQEISNITRYLEMSGVEALIWTDMDMLEEAYARLPISQCHFLVDGSDIEALMIMSGAIRRGKTMDQLHDTSRDGEFGALHRISDELADFARTLAKIAEQDENIGETSLSRKAGIIPSRAFQRDAAVHRRCHAR